MKKRTSRLLSALLALCMVLPLLPGTALAADTDFNIKDGVLTKYNGPGGAVTIPNGVTAIGYHAFYKCENLTGVTIPDSVTKIEDGAFSDCSALTGVTIPDSVTSIGKNAFSSCKNLTSVTISANADSIGEHAFWDCGSLTSVTIPSSVTQIGTAAFRSCESLTSINVASGNATYSSVDGVLFSTNQTRLHTYPAGKSASSYTIPESVNNIRDYAFSDCKNLTSVTIPSAVTFIGRNAFSGCGSLTDVYYGGSSTHWGSITIKEFNEPLASANVHYGGTAEQPSSWAASAVQSAVDHQIVPMELLGGYTQPITRAEFCALANKLYEAVTGYAIIGRTTFTDTDDVNVQKMAYLGVVAGMGDGTFAPNASLTRQQAAIMLSQLAKALDRPLAETAATFSDNGQIASWALTAVGQVQAAGIMSGTGNNNFSPAGQYTREQSIITMLKIYDLATKPPQVSGNNYIYLALQYIYNHLKVPSSMDVQTVRSGPYDRREFFKDAPDFVKPTHSFLSWSDDYYVVSMTIKAANSFGALTTETYVSLFDLTTGKTYHDLVGYAESAAKGAYGSTKLAYMDLKSEALLLAASIKFDTVPQEEVNRIASSIMG